VNRGELILDDRACVSCGYSLKGIPASGNCPECGHAVRRSVKSNRYDDSLVNAPLGWLRALSTGAYLLAFSGFGFLGGYVGLAFSPGPPLSLFVLALVAASAAGWWVGVWMCTRPRPVTGNTLIPPEREWGRLRLIARISQAGWGIAVMIAGVQAVMSPVGMLNQLMSGLVGLSVLGALGGHMALCLYVSRLADWANDSGLSNHFKSASYLVLAVVVSNGLMFLAPFLGFFVILFSVLMILVSLAAVVHFYIGLWQFASMARWAVINNANASARDQRLRERAERARRVEAEPAAAPPAGSRVQSTPREYVATEMPPVPLAESRSDAAQSGSMTATPAASSGAATPTQPASSLPASPKPKWERERASSKPIERADVYDLATEEPETRG
jgi:predicted RNA-binding Zn-ribbon protein involved in translation (DUF1610 family)